MTHTVTHGVGDIDVGPREPPASPRVTDGAAPPGRGPAVRRAAAAFALVPVVLLGGCTSSGDGGSGGGGGRNAPLPRMSRAAAQAWARQLAASVAASAGTTLDPEDGVSHVSDCVSRHGEVVTDGRFNLDYLAELPMPAARQGPAAARVRADLERRGYRIASFRDDPTKDPAVRLRALDKETGGSLEVSGSTNPAELDVAVSTVCLLPPGARQKHFRQ